MPAPVRSGQIDGRTAGLADLVGNIASEASYDDGRAGWRRRSRWSCLATPPHRALARRALADVFGDHARCGELLLCVSEVVTNAVLHARSAATITVRRTADLLRVEVRDDDPSPPVRQPHSTIASTGRGLRILDDLAVRWGTRPTDAGKVVWFDFDLAEAS